MKCTTLNWEPLKSCPEPGPAQHPEFSDIQRFMEKELSTIDMQLISHHIINCPRCEAIWERLIHDNIKAHQFRAVTNIFGLLLI